MTESSFVTTTANRVESRLRGCARRTWPAHVAPIDWTKTCSIWPDTCNTGCLHNKHITTQRTATGFRSLSTTATWKILSGVLGRSQHVHPFPSCQSNRISCRKLGGGCGGDGRAGGGGGGVVGAGSGGDKETPTGRLHRSRRRAFAPTVSRQSSRASSGHTFVRTIGRRTC